MKPHKHAELIKLWADGAEMQIQNAQGKWVDIDPCWSPNCSYRIKPQVEYVYAEVEPYKSIVYFNKQTDETNLRLSFLDGKLVSAEVIK